MQAFNNISRRKGIIFLELQGNDHAGEKEVDGNDNYGDDGVEGDANDTT